MPAVEPGRALAGSTRARPTVLLAAAAVLLIARIAIGIGEGRLPATMPDMVRWQPIEGAEAAAHAQGKPVLYDFTADWCAPCLVMQREVFADPAEAAEIERLFVPVRVLDRQREEGRNPAAVDSLQRRYGVSSFPTLVVVPPAGGEPVNLVGYPGPTQLMGRLRAARMQALLPAALRPPARTAPTR